MENKDINWRLEKLYVDLQDYQNIKTRSPIKWYLKRGVMDDFRRQLKIKLSFIDSNDEELKSNLLFYLLTEIIDLEVELEYKSMFTYFQGVFKLEVLNEVAKIVKCY